MKYWIFSVGIVIAGLCVLSGQLLAQTSFDGRGGVTYPGGSIIAGYDSRTCGSGAPGGAIRYNSASTCVEFCDGASWVCPQASCTAPSLCPNVGDVCDDGNGGTSNDPIFAGFIMYSSTTNCEAFFVTDNNQSAASAWSTSTGNDDVAVDSYYDGAAIDAQVANSTTFPAFKVCKDLANGGFTDWYLPSMTELLRLYENKSAIDLNAAGSFTVNEYWSSSESDADLDRAYQILFVGAAIKEDIKNKTFDVRCVRRD